MKIRIKTAHGYLSFQPNGAIQYRPGVGPWEEIELEGFEVLQPQPEPEPQPEPAPAPSESPAYVAAVKAWLTSRGVSLTGPCGAFAITKMVAWGLRGRGVGLVLKPSGNNCEGCSVDYLSYKDGTGVDILGDAGGNNTPQWAVKPGEFTPDRWKAPVQP